MVKIDPPGTWCHNEAVLELVKKSKAKSFVEVGCGAADLSSKLCEMGLKGYGIDFSADAIKIASEKMKPFIENGQYQLIHGDIFKFEEQGIKVDLGVSMMVMEHVEDDIAFIKKICSVLNEGGHLLIGVPGRRDRWGIEDETVGHLRRYDKVDLESVLKKSGLSNVVVWSVAVPVANILFHIGNYLVKKNESHKKELSLREQTETSGIREIPFKTVFPSYFNLILNRVTLYPLFLIQRLFYSTGLGLTMLGLGKVPSQK